MNSIQKSTMICNLNYWLPNYFWSEILLIYAYKWTLPEQKPSLPCLEHHIKSAVYCVSLFVDAQWEKKKTINWNQITYLVIDLCKQTVSLNAFRLQN